MLVFRAIKFTETRQDWGQDFDLKTWSPDRITERRLPPTEQGSVSLKHLTQPLTIIYAGAESW
jgi:hypothetical protein